jgi:hypothetical protein
LGSAKAADPPGACGYPVDNDLGSMGRPIPELLTFDPHCPTASDRFRRPRPGAASTSSPPGGAIARKIRDEIRKPAFTTGKYS